MEVPGIGGVDVSGRDAGNHIDPGVAQPPDPDSRHAVVRIGEADHDVETPDAITASTHGAVRPWWAHGSSVTMRVPLRAASPAASSAAASACAEPGPTWARSESICPCGERTMAPTRGFGCGLVSVVRATACRISSSARRSLIKLSSTRRVTRPPSPIRTLTVGLGISPSRPQDGVRGLSPPVGDFTLP